MTSVPENVIAVLFFFNVVCQVFYMKVLETGTTHPGAKEKSKHAGILVQQNTFAIGQAIDMAGNFASWLKTVQK